MKELKDLLPPLTGEEYKQLEKNIKENGFDRNFPIMEWHGYIADGHNRYSICKKYNIEPVIGTLAYDTKEEVMRWMLDIQLGRRNLSPIQRIVVAEKYRPIYEKIAQEKKNSTDYYNIKINIEKFDIPDNFGIIYFDELNKIINFKEELKGVKVNDEEIDLTRMYSAYILILLSYLRVNLNRNPDKPLCCYRLYQKITEDIGLSERYISRIVEMLDVMNIVKFQEGKRIRYKKEETKYGFLTTPKVFADYKRFTKDEKGNQNIDNSYDYKTEIQNQLDILE